MQSRILANIKNKQWAITSLLVIAISMFRPIDDGDNIVNIFVTNGLYSQTASTWNIYSGVLLCTVIGKLHTIFSHINVYTLMTWIITGQQLFVVNYWLCHKIKQEKMLLCSYIIEIVTFGCLLQILNINYTVQSAFSMCTQIICIDMLDQTSSKVCKYGCGLMQLLYCMYGIQLRVKSGLLMIPYFGLYIIIRQVQNQGSKIKINFKKLIQTQLVLVVALSQILIDIYLIKNDSEYNDQYYYDKYRAYYSDYSNEYGSYVASQAGLWVLADTSSINREQLENETNNVASSNKVQTGFKNLVLQVLNYQAVQALLMAYFTLSQSDKNDKKKHRSKKVCIDLLNNIGSIALVIYFLFSGRYIDGLGRVWLCIYLGWVTVRLCNIDSDSDNNADNMKLSNKSIILLTVIIQYCVMQQIYQNKQHSNINTINQLYIENVEYDSSNTVYSLVACGDMTKNDIDNGRFIIYKSLGQTAYGMQQYRDSIVYKDNILDKVISGEYELCLDEHSQSDILQIIQYKYKLEHDDNTEIQFRLVNNQNNKNYYIAECIDNEK